MHIWPCQVQLTTVDDIGEHTGPVDGLLVRQSNRADIGNKTFWFRDALPPL